LFYSFLIATSIKMTSKPDKEIPEQDILDAVRELRFGVVEVHVHESRVTEIRQIRRTRFQSKTAARGATSSREEEN
jgi:hypothetical protein